MNYRDPKLRKLNETSYEDIKEEDLFTDPRGYRLSKYTDGNKIIYSIYDPEDYLISEFESKEDVNKDNVENSVIFRDFMDEIEDYNALIFKDDIKEDIIFFEDGYYVTKGQTGKYFHYNIYNNADELLKSFDSVEDVTGKEFTKTGTYKVFKKAIQPKQQSLFNPGHYEDDDDWWYGGSRSGGYNSYWGSSWYKPKTPEEIEAEKEAERKKQEEILKKYSTSDTLCIHKTDPTTTMLEQVYAGRGWDVINDVYSVSKETLHTLIANHKRIVGLGHGTSWGLIGSIDGSCAPYMKDKKLFFLWCNADGFSKNHPELGTGYFSCGNMPSDDGEARAVGCHVSHKYMDDNITYWCKLCGDVVEQCLEGRAAEGCKYVRDEYWKVYGNNATTKDELNITLYNYRRTKVAGEDLIDVPADYPDKLEAVSKSTEPEAQEEKPADLEHKA